MSAPPLHKEANTAVEEADTARQASDLAALRRMEEEQESDDDAIIAAEQTTPEAERAPVAR